MDEIRLFEELQPPPPADAPRMREAARARLTVTMDAPPAHQARRLGIVVPIAAATALAAAGAGYGLTAAQGSSGSLPAASSRLPVTTAGLTAVQGCPGEYITAGTLERVTGRRLVIQPANDTDRVNRAWRAKPVTVATSASTAITVPATGNLGDITDGSRVMVSGTWSGRKLAATQVSIQAGLPPANAFGPRIPRHPGHLLRIGPPVSKSWLGPPFGTGTVEDAHDGGFTLVSQNPLLRTRRIQVVTSTSTKVETDSATSLSQLTLGANVVAVGPIGRNGVMTASTVAEPAGGQVLLAGGPVKVRSSGCSAAAITTAVLLPSG